MSFTPGDEDREETARESRIKILLLVTALVLVAGYAAAVTELGTLLASTSNILSEFGPAIPALSGAALGATLLGLILYALRRWRGGRAHRLPADPADALAGLADRRSFLGSVAGHCEIHAKSGRQFAIHVVDIDRFRAVNDALGMAEADGFLRLVAEQLLILVDRPDRLARLGDDEFAVIQPDAGAGRHTELYARRIQDIMKDACAQVGRHVRPGASIGVAVWPDHGSDPVRLLNSASLALRSAKSAGGDCFRIYTRDMEMAVEDRLQAEKAIGNGLHEGWFELHFQPQYDLSSRRLTGFEALVRMQHPERGELLPDVFLPAAEESGLIQPLGDWIIGEALRVAADWPPHLTLAVNVSAVQFRQGDVATTILEGLLGAGIEAQRLRIEIPESVLLEPSDTVHDQLRRLKGSGVVIVVDDFGLDASSLRMLARSPCDAVKLDRSFVRLLGEEPEIDALLRSLIATAQAFGLAISAEGVERAEQAHFLLSHGCRNVQGNLLGRPAPLREVAAIIAKDMRNLVAREQAASVSKIERSG